MLLMYTNARSNRRQVAILL